MLLQPELFLLQRLCSCAFVRCGVINWLFDIKILLFYEKWRRNELNTGGWGWKSIIRSPPPPLPSCMREAQIASYPVSIRPSFRISTNMRVTLGIHYTQLALTVINPLTPELNPSAQRWLTRFFTGDFASWTVHFVIICLKNQQIHQLPMVSVTCFGITLSSSGSVSSAFWEMLNCGVVDRILWVGVLCLSESTRNVPWG
jgi:hypothetical protein